MKLAIMILFVAACGGTQQPAASGRGTGVDDPPGVVTDTRTPFEQRLNKACTNAGEKLTACAVADVDAKLAAGEISKKEHDDLVKPELQQALTDKYVENCDQPQKRSSRQIRVLEVCFEQETECAPFLDCLDNFNKAP